MAGHPSPRGADTLGIYTGPSTPAGPPVQRHEDPTTPGGGVSDLDGISTGELVIIAQRLTPGKTRDDLFEDQACSRSFAGYDR